MPILQSTHAIDRPSRRSAAWTVCATIAVAAAVTIGWNEFWFLTDDAFIAFRYSANIVDGFGATWNRAPFVPVEGYTSAAWTFLHAGIWSWFGIEPPAIANSLGLACAFVTLAVCALWCRRTLRRHSRTDGHWIALVALLAIATQPVFLTWSSSGLETPLFVASSLAWAYVATARPNDRGPRWAFALTAAATVAACTRPDGLTLVGMSVVMLGIVAIQSERRRLALSIAGCVPVLAIVAHFVWRHSYYGEWLPNTYYAKVLDAWPESGLRYLATFTIENGVWLGLVIVAWASMAEVWRSRPPRARPLEFVDRHLGVLATTGAFGFMVAYYTISVGGDHFGFRVFCHLIPLMFVTAHAAIVGLRLRPVPAVVALVCLIAASHSIGWLRHATSEAHATVQASRHVVTEDTPDWLRWIVTEPVPDRTFLPLAPHVPRVLRSVFEQLDRWNAWMHAHLVCQRRAVHVRALRRFVEQFPTREVGLAIDTNDRPVIALSAVGYAGWSMPDVAVIDMLGLNDRVVARHLPAPLDAKLTTRWAFEILDTDHDARITTEDDGGILEDVWLVLSDRNADGALDFDEFARAMELTSGRRMAHDRAAPPGYVEAFRPNVHIEHGRARVEPREHPLTDDEVRAIEARYFAEVRR